MAIRQLARCLARRRKSASDCIERARKLAARKIRMEGNKMAEQTADQSKPVAEPQAVVSVPIHQTAIYTYKEAAALSKCSYVTIWRAVASGKLKATAVGNQPRIIGAELLKWIEGGGETGRSKATR